MLTTRAFLLPHYRQALTEALANCVRPGSLPFANGDPESWATDAETAGWLDPADAIQIRRLARKVRFYERRNEL